MGSKQSKIISSDIDGVLNCNKTPNPHDLPYVVDKRLLRVFNRLVARTRAKVVLISDWRYDSAGLFSAREQGIKFEDAVPDWPKKSRGDEIRAWLRKHPDIVRFAVIDDDDDELDGLPLFQPSSASRRQSVVPPQARCKATTAPIWLNR
jgi:HAD domain in Swiss Army Knife RNA repair proteins